MAIDTKKISLPKTADNVKVQTVGDKLIAVYENAEGEMVTKTLPGNVNKEETEIGEDGSLISVGEKQRIGIARALYLERQILICDEITSALDVKTSENILNCLKNISKEKTIIFISHNQEVISAATRKVPL